VNFRGGTKGVDFAAGLSGGTMHTRRREFLKAGLGAGALFLPLPYAWVWAQSEGTLKLLRAPKVALVMGNGKYKDAPELKNAPNDAKAIAETLKAAGFAVDMKLDTGREALIGAIREYVHTMEQKKAVGLFYFAGHGVQLDWRNYLLPIDAVIDRIEDVAKQSVDLARLMEGLTKAANPMNVVILDACRENPFGTAKPVAQKGLSQMDAPTQTILAYATSPGNVASDGDGANGLYTENLLREIKVPEAKIEDVFKRVRLGVRRKSNGAQIPWESTSLEEDFWFLPPKNLQQPDEAEKEKRFEEELALWEKLKSSAAPAPLEDFLRRFPSGPFAELAQLQLERVLAALGEKRVRIVSQDGNPFTRGSAEADMKWKVGDRYTYRRTDLLGVEAPHEAVHTVGEITGDEVRYSNGHVSDLLGNVLRRAGGRIYSPNQLEPLEYVVGKQWVTQYRITTPKGGTGRNEMELRIVAREPVTVPAGTFNAFRIEGRGVFEEESGRVEVTKLTKWAAPERLRREVAMEETRESSSGGGRGQGGGSKGKGKGGGGRGGRGSRVTNSQRWELVSFKQA
jgi:uncharacterized caspase-like protein/uncharacterized membrane protein YgcG